MSTKTCYLRFTLRTKVYQHTEPKELSNRCVLSFVLEMAPKTSGRGGVSESLSERRRLLCPILERARRRPFLSIKVSQSLDASSSRTAASVPPSLRHRSSCFFAHPSGCHSTASPVCLPCLFSMPPEVRLAIPTGSWVKFQPPLQLRYEQPRATPNVQTNFTTLAITRLPRPTDRMRDVATS